MSCPCSIALDSRLGRCSPLVRGLYAFQYPSPLHYKVVAGLIYNTSDYFCEHEHLLNGYARRLIRMIFERFSLSGRGG